MLPVPPNRSSVCMPSISRLFWMILNKPSFAISVVGRVCGIFEGGFTFNPPKFPLMIRMAIISIRVKRNVKENLLKALLLHLYYSTPSFQWFENISPIHETLQNPGQSFLQHTAEFPEEKASIDYKPSRDNRLHLLNADIQNFELVAIVALRMLLLSCD